MSSLRNCSIFLFALGCIIVLGCTGGNSGPDPEQTARMLFEMEWEDRMEETWDLFHPIWHKYGFDGNYARYANDMGKKNKVWAEHPRTITRSKSFSGNEIPIGAQRFAVDLGRDKYDFSVVRIAIDYPKVEGYRGGAVEYLITLAKKKEKGSQWQIISQIDEVGVTSFFNW